MDVVPGVHAFAHCPAQYVRHEDVMLQEQQPPWLASLVLRHGLVLRDPDDLTHVEGYKRRNDKVGCPNQLGGCGSACQTHDNTFKIWQSSSCYGCGVRTVVSQAASL